VLVRPSALRGAARRQREPRVQRALGEWLTPGDELFFEALDRATPSAIHPASRVVATRSTRRQRRQRHRDLRAPQSTGCGCARRLAAAPDRTDGQLPRGRATCHDEGAARLLGDRGHEEESQRRVRRHRSLIRAALPGGGGVRYRGRRSPSAGTIRASSRAGTRRSRGSSARWRCSGSRRPTGDWLPIATVSRPRSRGPRHDSRSLGRLGAGRQPLAALRRRGRQQARKTPASPRAVTSRAHRSRQLRAKRPRAPCPRTRISCTHRREGASVGVRYFMKAPRQASSGKSERRQSRSRSINLSARGARPVSGSRQ